MLELPRRESRSEINSIEPPSDENALKEDRASTETLSNPRPESIKQPFYQTSIRPSSKENVLNI